MENTKSKDGGSTIERPYTNTTLENPQPIKKRIKEGITNFLMFAFIAILLIGAHALVNLKPIETAEFDKQLPSIKVVDSYSGNMHYRTFRDSGYTHTVNVTLDSMQVAFYRQEMKMFGR
jgi:hypothetical protein